MLQLQLLSAALAVAVDVAAAARRPFTPAEFRALKRELHTLPRASAERRFAEVEPLSSPPPHQEKIDHVSFSLSCALLSLFSTACLLLRLGCSRGLAFGAAPNI